MRYVIQGIIVGQSTVCDIVVEERRVVSIEPAGNGPADIGSPDSIISPTLFDIQVNGVRGIDLQAETLQPEDVRRMTDVLAAWGVSHWVPTLVTGPLSTMERACRVIVEAMADPRVKRAVPGIHLEGPFISPDDGPRGAHPRAFVCKPNIRAFDRLLNAAGGKVLYITLAPEWAGAMKLIKHAVQCGILVSLGHHNADAHTISEAVDAGAQLCTHLGNGLAAMVPRHHNPLWPQLADDRLTASLIADLEHLPAPVLKTFIRAKGPDKVIFTSDCVHVALLKPGVYALAGSAVELKRSGRVCLMGTEFLAGSGVMLLQSVVNAARVTGLSLEQCVACAATVPGKFFGLKHAFTPPAVGQRPDMVVFDILRSRAGWKASVRGVFLDGEHVPPLR